jgi:hypothetical protein
MWSASPATRWTGAADGSSRSSTATAAARTIRSTGPAAPCTPASTSSPTKQQLRLETLFADDNDVQVEATWGIYQRMITAYRQPDRVRGRELMANLIDALSSGFRSH